MSGEKETIILFTGISSLKELPKAELGKFGGFDCPGFVCEKRAKSNRGLFAADRA